MTEAEKIARQMARERGHNDPEAEITLVGGARVPAWALYMEDAYRRSVAKADASQWQEDHRERFSQPK